MSVAFTVEGPVPSKSNHRHAAHAKNRAAWARIKQYEQEVGLSAIAAGAKKHLGSGEAHVTVLLLNQSLDVDNAAKVGVDALKGIAYPDDAPRFLRSVGVAWEEDDGPVRAEYRIRWAEA